MVLLGMGVLFGISGYTGGTQPFVGSGMKTGAVLVPASNPDPLLAAGPPVVENAPNHLADSPPSFVDVELPPLLSDVRFSQQQQPDEDSSYERIVGRIFAWLCTTLYLTSRLPQIWKNVSCSCAAKVIRYNTDDGPSTSGSRLRYSETLLPFRMTDSHPCDRASRCIFSSLPFSATFSMYCPCSRLIKPFSPHQHQQSFSARASRALFPFELIAPLIRPFLHWIGIYSVAVGPLFSMSRLCPSLSSTKAGIPEGAIFVVEETLLYGMWDLRRRQPGCCEEICLRRRGLVQSGRMRTVLPCRVRRAGVEVGGRPYALMPLYIVDSIESLTAS